MWILYSVQLAAKFIENIILLHLFIQHLSSSLHCFSPQSQVRDGYRLEKPEHCRRELYNIMYYCWAKDAQDRPTFTELVKLLDKLLLTEMDYIQLEHFPDHNYYNMLSLSGEKL